MQLPYRGAPSLRWLAISWIVTCLACSGDDDADTAVAVQRAQLLAAGAGAEEDADGGGASDLDAGSASCSPTSVEDSVCNGVDDDCNGATDEDYVPVSTTCGVGVCGATGVTACIAGAVQDDCSPGEPLDACNGLDDDCDGATDEDEKPEDSSCGVGACAATGVLSCVGGVMQDSCTPGTPAASDATCDGADDDCDGTSDEEYAAHVGHCGVGACAAVGVVSCVSGTVNDTCTPAAPGAHDALCNGVDDDCNGQTDEDFPAQSTACGLGACAAAGATFCAGGIVQDNCTPGAAGAHDQLCDGTDDDCNGATDEDYAPQGTACGIGACAATGVTSCVAGEVQDSCLPGLPAGSDATCDGVDDDCSGAADEDHGFVCEGSIVTSCVAGTLAYVPCSDDDACNGEEGCEDGACTEGVPPDPDDGNDCTIDGCAPESGVFHGTAPVGTTCEGHGVCDGTTCVIPRSCREWLRLAPASADGVYRIDIDGTGPVAELDVYCDMTVAGGGWQLITVSQPNRALIGTGYCQSPAADPACAGQLHPLQASARSEVLVRDLESGAWLVYGGFSGGAQSALRYFTRERSVDTSSSCTNGNVCDDVTADPALRALQTSGFPLVHVAPLHQWWRFGGWWVGAATASATRIHSSSYMSTFIAPDMYTGMGSRTSLSSTVPSVPVGGAEQAIYHRDDGCADGAQDGIETDVDCGGGTCDGCTADQACNVHADCATGLCTDGACAAAQPSCGAVLASNPLAASGRYVIDVDGPGAVEALAVYCDMTTDGGGWQLISSVRSDLSQLIVGDRYCTDPSPELNCHGQMHPVQVTTGTEIMVHTPATGDYAVYDAFSASATSALRYFSRERSLTSGASCSGTHVCGDSTRDPALRVARTSGYPLQYNPPLAQWWRLGGWWLGANPGAGSSGLLHATGYNGTTELRARPDAEGASILQSAEHQLVLFRNPASGP
jgi:hypothetical protein